MTRTKNEQNKGHFHLGELDCAIIFRVPAKEGDTGEFEILFPNNVAPDASTPQNILTVAMLGWLLSGKDESAAELLDAISDAFWKRFMGGNNGNPESVSDEK